MALGVLVHVERAKGRHEAALDLALQSASIAGEIRFSWWQLHYLYLACEICLELDRPGEAEGWGRKGLPIAHDIGDRQMTVYLLALLSAAAAAQGDSERAGHLWGAVEREEERGPVGQWEGEREQYWSRVDPDDPKKFELGRASGRRLSAAETIEFALSID